MEGGVLVPCRHQPVGGECGGQSPSDDEAEVAGACSRDEARFGASGQGVDHRGGVFGDLGQRPREGTAYGSGIGAGGHRPLIERRKKRLRVLNGCAEAGGAVNHEPDHTRRLASRRAAEGVRADSKLECTVLPSFDF